MCIIQVHVHVPVSVNTYVRADRSVPSGHGGVQYYMHEPRTREEEEICKVYLRSFV